MLLSSWAQRRDPLSWTTGTGVESKYHVRCHAVAGSSLDAVWEERLAAGLKRQAWSESFDCAQDESGKGCREQICEFATYQLLFTSFYKFNSRGYNFAPVVV